MRDAFANKVAVVIDERDRGELADREAEKDDMPGVVSEVEHVKVSKRVSAFASTFMTRDLINLLPDPLAYNR